MDELLPVLKEYLKFREIAVGGTAVDDPVNHDTRIAGFDQSGSLRITCGLSFPEGVSVDLKILSDM